MALLIANVDIFFHMEARASFPTCVNILPRKEQVSYARNILFTNITRLSVSFSLLRLTSYDIIFYLVGLQILDQSRIEYEIAIIKENIEVEEEKLLVTNIVEDKVGGNL